MNYPENLYKIFIIADSFKEETIIQLEKLRVTVFQVAFEKSTKTKSLNIAFEKITEDFDIAVICDADNILSKNFLQYIDNGFQSGFTAIQETGLQKTWTPRLLF